MATYKLTGTRYLRKYTAKSLSPVYSAALDAQTVVDDFCTVPWQPVLPKSSQLAYHTDEVVDEESGRTGLDENVAIRDSLDAALFCAEHKGGMHRAFAQALCLRFTLPDDAVGASLSSLKLKISSDPYNSGGCRVSAFTNSTGEIPMSCSAVRTGAVYAQGVVPRTSQTQDGQTYWYAASGAVTLAPASAITLQKYLFVFCGLEDYSITRGNWLEGSATLRNLVEIVTSADVPGWTDGETYDLADAATASPSSICLTEGSATPIVTAAIDLPYGTTVGNLADAGYYNLHLFYSKFHANAISSTIDHAADNRLAFAQPHDSDGKTVGFFHSYMFLHFYMPDAFVPAKFRFLLGKVAGSRPSGLDVSPGSLARVWLKPAYVEDVAPLAKDTGFAVAAKSSLDGWTLQGSVDLTAPDRDLSSDHDWEDQIVDPSTGDSIYCWEYSCAIDSRALGNSRVGTLLIAPYVDPRPWSIVSVPQGSPPPPRIGINCDFPCVFAWLDA